MEGRSKVGSKARRRLTQGQMDILSLLYRFRFGTTELLAVSLNKKSGAFVHPRLTTLVEQGFIGRTFDSGYRLQNKHASYYLLPRGMRLLLAQHPQKGLDNQAIKNSYKDKSVSEAFIDHSLSIYAVSNRLIALHPNIQLFTKRELTIYDYFPKPLPDLYISLKVKNETRRFLLELYEASNPPFVIDRRLRQLIEYYQNEAWQSKGSPFPPILCVCETSSIERRLQKQVARALSKTDTDMQFYTTTVKALLGSDRETAIWSDVMEPECLISLSAILK